MFNIGPGELLIIVIVAVIVIGPKDLPLAMRTAGRWIGKIRRISSHFQAGIDTMIREAEMEEMEKKWAEQNAKIMKEHPVAAPPEMELRGALPPHPVAPAAEPLSSAETSAEARVHPAVSEPAPAPTDEPQLPYSR